MSYLESAMRDAAVEPRDDRGLMPIAEARKCVSRRKVFARGKDLQVGEHHLLEADRVWAALLSLADAAEFVKIASRLKWDHPQRGRDNDAPWERYGDAVLPWLEAALGSDGRFPPNLWTAAPCLLRIGGEGALDLAARVKRAGFLASWLDAHPEGWPILVRRAAGGDPSAAGGLTALGQDDPAVVREQVRALDPGLYDRLGLPAMDPGVDAVLAEVEPVSVPVGRRLSMTRVSAHVREFDYPMWDNANYATGWIRVTGFVSPVADALVFQSICTGLGEANIRREIHRMGPPGHTVVHRLELLPEEALFSWDGDALVCVATGVRQVRGAFQVPPEGARRAVHVPLVGAEVPLAADTSAMKPPVAEQFARLGPELGLMARLGQDHRGVVLASGDALRQLAGLDAGAVRLFEFDGFVSPLAGEPATASIDLVAMVEALRRRLPITRLPRGGHPLAGLYDRLQVPHIQWGSPKFLG